MMQNVDNLAAILADMVHSALAWEQEHGLPPCENRKIGRLKPLTSTISTDRLNPSGDSSQGESDGHQV